jgi:glucokinase
MIVELSADRFALIADIGGTNARFALCDLHAAEALPLAELTLACDSFDSLGAAAKHYLQQATTQAALGKDQPTTAVVAVASPIMGDEVRMTNRNWTFSQHNLANELGLRRLLAINDFAAMAWGVTALQPQDVSVLYDAGLQGLHLQQGPITVMGPGTGLGVALLVGNSSQWQAVATEGGHVSFAPLNDEEVYLQQALSHPYQRCSTERLLCGIGLSHIDAALRARNAGIHDPAAIDFSADNLRDPGVLVAQAQAGEADAHAALSRFCSMLGAAAGDAVLMHGAKVLVLAGGILPRFVDYLKASEFLESFLAKARFRAFMKRVPIYLATHRNPGILGAAVYAHQLSKTHSH